MGFLVKLKEKAIEAVEFFKGFLVGLRSKAGLLPGILNQLNRRVLIIGLGGLMALILVLLIGATVSRSRERRADAAPQLMSVDFTISIEDLFLPSEPEFVPEFLLEQEPKSFWSIEDIRPYWINPAGSEVWRNEIMSAVDRLLEGVRLFKNQ